MKYAAPKYMYDVLPYPPAKESWLFTAKWRYVEGVFREVCRRFGYKEIRTPILEPTELFTRTIGDATDIVSKEMFTFTDTRRPQHDPETGRHRARLSAPALSIILLRNIPF